MKRCKTCNTVFKTKAAILSHRKSYAHVMRSFVVRYKRFRMPVMPHELELLQAHGVKDVLYGPRVITRPGWARQRQKTRANPWVKKTEVRKRLILNETLMRLLRKTLA